MKGMEDLKIFDLAYKLRQEIDESTVGQALLKSEASLNKDEEALNMQQQVEEKSVLYHEALLTEDENKIKVAQHELYLVKLAFDQLPVVKEYRKNYAQVRLIYEMINKEVFSHFQSVGIACQTE